MENRQTPPFLLGGNDFKFFLFTTCSEVACCWMACSHTSFVLTHPPIFLHQTVERLHMVVDLFGHLSAFFFFDNWRGHGLYFLWHAVKYFLALLSFEVNHIKDHFSLLLNTHNGQDSNGCSFQEVKTFRFPLHWAMASIWEIAMSGRSCSLKSSTFCEIQCSFFRFPGDSTQIQGGFFL